VWEIAAVQGTAKGEPVVESIFRFDARDGDGASHATGFVPTLVETLRERGEPLPVALFDEGPDA
jgi:hypothetical protein